MSVPICKICSIPSKLTCHGEEKSFHPAERSLSLSLSRRFVFPEQKIKTTSPYGGKSPVKEMGNLGGGGSDPLHPSKFPYFLPSLPAGLPSTHIPTTTSANRLRVGNSSKHLICQRQWGGRVLDFSMLPVFKGNHSFSMENGLKLQQHTHRNFQKFSLDSLAIPHINRLKSVSTSVPRIQTSAFTPRYLHTSTPRHLSTTLQQQ